MLFQNRAQLLLFNLLAALLLVTLKGFTKAMVSTQLGDLLPRRYHRVTLNPVAHIEPVGLLLFTLTGFGWEKPVGTTRMNYKNRQQGILLTHLVPLAVVLMVSVIANNLLFAVPMPLNAMRFLHSLSRMGSAWVIWQLLPIYPLEGQMLITQFLSPNQVMKLANMEKTILIILIAILLILPNNPITIIPAQLGSSLLQLLRFV